MRMTRRWLLAGTLTLVSLRAPAASEPFPAVGFDERLSGDAVLAAALSRSSLDQLPPLAVRLIVHRDEIERSPGAYDFAALDARMAAYDRFPGVRVYLDLRETPPSLEAIEASGRFVRAVATRYRTSVEGFIFGVPSSGASPFPAPESAFYIKTTSVQIRAGDEDALVILGRIAAGDAPSLASLYEQEVAPYVDAIGLVAGEARAAIVDVVEKHDPGAAILVLGEPLEGDPPAARQRFLETELEVLGTRVSAVTWAASPEAVREVLFAVGALRGLFGPQIVALDDEAVGVKIRRGGREVTDAVPHRVLFDAASATRYLMVLERDAPLELELSEPTGVRPVIVDPSSDERRPVSSFSYDAIARVATFGLPRHPGPVIVDWSHGERSDFSAGEEVTTRVLPGVAEILARHQQARARQDAALSSWVANATMEIHFRPTANDTGFDVETDNLFFVEGDQTEWVEQAFRLNGTDWSSNRPPFPLIQAEKVLSLPLDLRLDTDYRYRLEGTESVNGRECFVLRFDPVDEARSLLRGTVWIDRETWMKAKVQSVQTELSPPVLSSEEIQFFAPAGELEGWPIQLLSRLVTRQILLLAGRSLLVEREVRFEGFELDPADFAARRAAARASDRIMFRDTDEGLRYLVKRGGERVVEDGTTLTAKAALVGVTFDPAYDYPLPIGGINYLDFNFLGKDNQLALVFGGVLALVNVQRPRLLGDRVDGSLDLFAIALEGSDRVYDAHGEREGERVLTRPFSTAINIGLRAGEFHRLVASYQFRYDHYSADDATAPGFEPPVSTSTHGLGLSWEWKRAGYSFAAGGSNHRRAEWEPWGHPGDFRPGDREYLKYSASLSKDVYAGLQKLHLNAAYFGGEDLDRFSEYQFGLFDETRIHGVPSSGIRFGELGMFRGSWSLNLFDQYRLDLFLEQAFGRDPRAASEWQGITGIGVGFNMRGPWNTLLRGDVGKSFLPPEYREPGSIVVQFQILKPL